MKVKLRCKICGDEHSNTSDNFPVVFCEQREVFEGKDKNRKSLGLRPVVVGYGCRKCVRKHTRSQFIKEHQIKPKGGQRLIEAISEKIKELRTQKAVDVS